MIRTNQSKICAWILLCMTLGIMGCNSPSPGLEESEQSSTEVAQVPPLLRVVSVDDEVRLADVIARNWSAETMGTIELNYVQSGNGDWSGISEIQSCDVLLFPSLLLGELVASNRIQPLNERLSTDRQSPEALRIDRDYVVRFGRQRYGKSLGSPLPVLICRKDIFDSLGISVPETWERYNEAANQISQAIAAGKLDSQIESAVCEPRDGEWDSQMLFVRAVGAWANRGRLSSFFDVSTMEPLIHTPPFVTALQQMTDLQPYTPAGLTPHQCYARILEGKTAMAIAFANGQPDVSDAKADVALTISALPTVDRWFDYRAGSWQPVDLNKEQRAVLVPVVGRMAGLGRSSRRLKTAQQFIDWLSSPAVNRQLAAQHSECFPAFAEVLSDSQSWFSRQLTRQAGDQLVRIVETMNDDGLAVMNLRLPGRNEFVAAMSAAIDRVLSGDTDPDTALKQVSIDWRQIVERKGLERMKKLFAQSVGVDF